MNDSNDNLLLIKESFAFSICVSWSKVGRIGIMCLNGFLHQDMTFISTFLRLWPIWPIWPTVLLSLIKFDDRFQPHAARVKLISFAGK